MSDGSGKPQSFDHIRDLLSYRPPPLVMRFLRYLGRGVNRHGMIGSGDRVLLSVSGGKDSLVLALGLRLRLRFPPVTYRLEALIEEAARINPRVRENINRAHTNIGHEYLPEL